VLGRRGEREWHEQVSPPDDGALAPKDVPGGVGSPGRIVLHSPLQLSV
jgi:hypothetical protein